MNYVVDFLITNSIHIVLTVAVFILLGNSLAADKDTRFFFFLILVLNSVYLIAAYVDTAVGFASPAEMILPRDAILRNITVGICYAIKAMMLSILMLAFHPIPKKRRLLVLLPGFLLAVLSVCSIFTGWVYYIDGAGLFHDGPLKNIYMGITFFIFFALLLILLVNIKKITKLDLVIALIIVVLCATSTIIGLTSETKFNYLSLSMILSIVLYFLCDFVKKSNLAIKHKDEELGQKQLQLMVSQIQPHFLYNTLSAIRDMCREEPLLAEKTLVDFSFYLRNNLDFGNSNNPMIPIEKELEHTKLYTNIEMTRFNRISVEYDIRDGGYSIPFLTVQPMVENAIRHGIRGIRNGCVQIVLTKEESAGIPYHKIVIKDNGGGKADGNRLGKHGGIGISNVKSRVETLCHGLFDIQFTPQGTTVTVLIPEETEAATDCR